MTERDSGWRTSVDGVVSDFGEVTQHLRRRQQQALRVAWSVVGACAAAMVGLIVFNLPPGIPGVASLRAPVQALLDPAVLSPGGEPVSVLPFHSPDPAPADPAPQPAAATTGGTAEVRQPAGSVRTRPAPITGLATTTPVTAPVVATPPAAAPPQPAPDTGLVDGLVKGVLHLIG